MRAAQIVLTVAENSKARRVWVTRIDGFARILLPLYPLASSCFAFIFRQIASCDHHPSRRLRHACVLISAIVFATYCRALIINRASLWPEIEAFTVAFLDDFLCGIRVRGLVIISVA